VAPKARQLQFRVGSALGMQNRMGWFKSWQQAGRSGGQSAPALQT
jgi:hypothetical protein